MISAAQSSREDLRSPEVWLPPAVLILLLLLLGLGGEAVRDLLRFDRSAVVSGEWWRLITANFVHLGWWHLFLNVLGIVVLVLLCPDRLSWAVWVRRLLLIGLAMSLSLLFLVPDVHWYVGLSGVAHGLFLLGLGRQAWTQKDLIAVGCICYIVGKIGWEMAFGVAVTDEQAIGGSVLVESHLYGSIWAVLYGLAFGAFTRTETFSMRRNQDE